MPDESRAVTGGQLSLLGEQFHAIHNFDRLAPFFMTVVSSSDHWLFLSSTGGLTAGRVDAESALFPYYTDDKIAENSENTGPKTILRVQGAPVPWEPFSARQAGAYRLERNLYKSLGGDKVVFEERNLSLGLRWRYAWRFSERYGVVRTAWLANEGSDTAAVEYLDGLQNLLPYGASTGLTGSTSNLLDAYKRSELHRESGLAIIALNATLSDRPEPSESLRATTAWSVGLTGATRLLSSEQVGAFRAGGGVREESDVRGRRGAYLLAGSLGLAPGEERAWSIAADVNQDLPAIEDRIAFLTRPAGEVEEALQADIAATSRELQAIVASADGLQASADGASAARHYANVLFNTMRGGAR
ncbi:MAG TPA: hypothetical protein VNT60_00905 [Deinococcales bacterium]|nr:hypothetical protein [Deinococcales bacterium]